MLDRHSSPRHHVLSGTRGSTVAPAPPALPKVTSVRGPSLSRPPKRVVGGGDESTGVGAGNGHPGGDSRPRPANHVGLRIARDQLRRTSPPLRTTGSSSTLPGRRGSVLPIPSTGRVRANAVPEGTGAPKGPSRLGREERKHCSRQDRNFGYQNSNFLDMNHRQSCCERAGRAIGIP